MGNIKRMDLKISSLKLKSAKEVSMRLFLMLCSVYTIYSFFYPEETNWQIAKKETMKNPVFEIASLNLQTKNHQGMITMLTCQSLCNPF